MMKMIMKTAEKAITVAVGDRVICNEEFAERAKNFDNLLMESCWYCRAKRDISSSWMRDGQIYI